MQDWFIRRDNYIGELEVLGAAAVYESLSEQLTSALVMHWVDNQSALWALVKGDTGNRNALGIVHSTALAQMRLRARVWYEYVESEANIADLPSRLDFTFVGRLRRQFDIECSWVPTRLPVTRVPFA